jgi:hypothetical protein
MDSRLRTLFLMSALLPPERPRREVIDLVGYLAKEQEQNPDAMTKAESKRERKRKRNLRLVARRGLSKATTTDKEEQA